MIARPVRGERLRRHARAVPSGTGNSFKGARGLEHQPIMVPAPDGAGGQDKPCPTRLRTLRIAVNASSLRGYELEVPLGNDIAETAS